MRIALDATYSVDSQPSGIGVYSREILAGLGRQFPNDTYLRTYRWKQWRRTGFRGRPLIPPIPTFRADVFHALNQRVDSRLARRVVCTFHDLFVMTAEYSSREYRERFTRQARVAAEKSDLIVAVSSFTSGQVHDLLNVPMDRIRVVPHGVHLSVRPRFTPPTPFVLSLGALQKRKNVVRLVEAFAAMPDDWRLILAGSPSGYQADEALAAIERSRCASRIQVTGYVDQKALEELYASATVFAFPSLDEGFGIPVLEAMAYGVPVLTANNSALGELGRDAALLVDPHNVDDMAEGLRTLALNPGLRERLAALGKTKAAGYSWDRSVALTHAAYEEAAR